MDTIILLIPIALFLGLLGLGAFVWSLRSGQYEDLEGAAHRILFDDDDSSPKGSNEKPGHGEVTGSGDSLTSR